MHWCGARALTCARTVWPCVVECRLTHPLSSSQPAHSLTQCPHQLRHRESSGHTVSSVHTSQIRELLPSTPTERKEKSPVEEAELAGCCRWSREGYLRCTLLALSHWHLGKAAYHSRKETEWDVCFFPQEGELVQVGLQGFFLPHVSSIFADTFCLRVRLRAFIEQVYRRLVAANVSHCCT